jgi:signal transduction histidine kinase
LAPARSAGRATGDNGKRRRVLIVDDDVDLAESLQDVLRACNYEVAIAHDSARAIEAAAAFEPQVAMLDVNLGQERGLSLMEVLKQRTPRLPCVVISARAEFDIAIEALRLGAFDYLIKPLHPIDMLARLDRCFEKIALECRADRAEAASTAKSAFLANISHELRTPLNAIIGFAEMIQGQVWGPLGSEKYHGYVDDIAASGRHLLDLINNILDLAKAEAGKLELFEEPVNLTDIAETCARMVAPRVEAGLLALSLSLPEHPMLMRGDMSKMRQIILNLLSNAIKFTPADGKIELTLQHAADGGCMLTVADTGIGMAPDDIPKVIQPFVQIDSSLARIYEGTGLGLALSSTFVDLHGGSMVIESALGSGTRVMVKLPPARSIDWRQHRMQVEIATGLDEMPLQHAI